MPLISGSEFGWSPISYGQWHARELQTFVEMFGLSPLQAINAATLTATRCLKRFGHEVGKLEAGRYADIIVLDGDPLKDITLLRKRKANSTSSSRAARSSTRRLRRKPSAGTSRSTRSF